MKSSKVNKVGAGLISDQLCIKLFNWEIGSLFWQYNEIENTLLVLVTFKRAQSNKQANFHLLLVKRLAEDKLITQEC